MISGHVVEGSSVAFAFVFPVFSAPMILASQKSHTLSRRRRRRRLMLEETTNVVLDQKLVLELSGSASSLLNSLTDSSKRIEKVSHMSAATYMSRSVCLTRSLRTKRHVTRH